MMHELQAYLMQSDGKKVAMPTDKLLVALTHVRARSSTREQHLSSDTAEISAFLQTLKAVMQDCKALPVEP